MRDLSQGQLHPRSVETYHSTASAKIALPRSICKYVGKTQNLKTAGITDDPEIQLLPFAVSGRNFDKARQTGLLFDGSIDAR